jgi:actin related protein 2/3 complex subunit 1A/1B
VTGSSDFKCRVFSAYIAGIDPEEDDGFGDLWANQHNFGDVLCEFADAGAWVQGVTWAPSGFRLAFAGHGSTMHFVQLLAGSDPIVQTVRSKHLPFLDIAFVNENSAVVGAGFGRKPVIYTASGSDAEPTWEETHDLDKGDGKEKKAAAPKGNSAFAAARGMFSDKVDRGGAKKASDNHIKTKHKNNIMNIAKGPANSSGAHTLFTTAGTDGQVIFWDLEKLNITL